MHIVLYKFRSSLLTALFARTRVSSLVGANSRHYLASFLQPRKYIHIFTRRNLFWKSTDVRVLDLMGSVLQFQYSEEFLEFRLT